VKQAVLRRLLYAALLLLFVLHNDLLTYHIGYCLVVSLVMALLVRHAWPRRLDDRKSDR